MSKRFKHAEAYRLMWYSCDCGHRERTWNSRDGIAPFGTNCPSCGDFMKHTRWSTDVLAPDHRPHRGQLVWSDGTPDEAAAIQQQRAEATFVETDSEAEKQDLIDYAVESARKTAAGEIQPGQEGFVAPFLPGWPVGRRAGFEVVR